MKRLLLLPPALCALILVVNAQDPARVGPPAAAPAVTVITAEKLTFDYKQSYAVFENDVKVADPGLDLTCERMTVHFDKEDDVESIVAKGSVLIVQDDFSATSEIATYDVKGGNIKLEVNPTVHKGRDVLKGGTIIYNRFTEKLQADKDVTVILHKKEGDARESILPGVSAP